MLFDNVISKEATKVDTKPKNNSDTLWVEKYRPQCLDDVIIPKRVRDQIQNFIDNGISRHILMYGGTGLGKTTIARILAKGSTSKFINASRERGIDVVRNEIVPFTKVASFSTTKILILDEIDNLSSDAMLSMRGEMESCAKTTRIIATCNYVQRLEKAIRSRFGCKIDFDFKGQEKKEVLIQKVKRIRAICEKEGITITDGAIKQLISKYADMRDIIESLQTMYEIGKTDITEEDILGSMPQKYDEFFKMVTTKSDLISLRKYIVSNYPNQYYNIIVAMGDKMVEWMVGVNHSKKALCGMVYVLSNRYKNDSINKPDQLTCLMALCAEIQHIMK